tara:strand:+ start:38077 stop:38469 length:393 start_codon:yes stop_codon:yes gene_type:complete
MRGVHFTPPAMHKTLTSFTGSSAPAEFDHPCPARLLEGNPLRTTWNHYEQDGVSAGAWSCEPGAWRIAFADDTDEFFHVLRGRIRITDEGGVAREFGAGEACVIPAGFKGVFEVLEAVSKHYVLVKRGAQ